MVAFMSICAKLSHLNRSGSPRATDPPTAGDFLLWSGRNARGDGLIKFLRRSKLYTRAALVSESGERAHLRGRGTKQTHEISQTQWVKIRSLMLRGGAAIRNLLLPDEASSFRPRLARHERSELADIADTLRAGRRLPSTAGSC